jgi:hypothetical protein
MLIIDNSVELMMKTFLAVSPNPEGSTNSPARAHFPDLLSALEKYNNPSANGPPLSNLAWYHSLRNALYHGGNGLTVERVHVLQYALQAKALFATLFGREIGIEVEPRRRVRGSQETAA